MTTDQGSPLSYHIYVNFLINALPDILDNLRLYLSIKKQISSLKDTFLCNCKLTPSSLVTQTYKGPDLPSHFPGHSNQQPSHTTPRILFTTYLIKTKPATTTNLKLSFATAKASPWIMAPPPSATLPLQERLLALAQTLQCKYSKLPKASATVLTEICSCVVCRVCKLLHAAHVLLDS